MAIFLLILAILCFAAGFTASLSAETIFHQIIGGISFVCAAIYLVGVGVINAIDKLHRCVNEQKSAASQ